MKWLIITLAIEAPGINGVSMPVGNASLYDLAADVKAIIDADSSDEAQTGVVVIGHAFGNRVMRATASRYPELVSDWPTSPTDFLQRVTRSRITGAGDGMCRLRSCKARLLRPHRTRTG